MKLTYKIKYSKFITRKDRATSIYDVENKTTINKWFEAGTELTVVGNKADYYRNAIKVTDGENFAFVDLEKDCYKYREVINLGGTEWIYFNSRGGKHIFFVELEKYKEGDELESKKIIEKQEAEEEEAKQKAIAKGNKESKNKSDFFGLVELKGSEKQVAWANTIRLQKLDCLSKERADKLLKIAATKKAKFWIDNRNKTGVQFDEFVEFYKLNKKETSFKRFWSL